MKHTIKPFLLKLRELFTLKLKIHFNKSTAALSTQEKTYKAKQIIHRNVLYNKGSKLADMIYL